MNRKQKLFQRPKQFGRELRVGDFIRIEMTDLLRNAMRDPRVDASLLTIADVKVSRDLAYADIYVSYHGRTESTSEAVILDVMQRAAGFFRSKLAQRHSMRVTPSLRFHVDKTEEKANRLEALLAQSRQS